MSAIPVAQFVVPGVGAATTASEQAFLGASVPMTVQFSNEGAPGATGYVPYVDLEIPQGLTFQAGSATFLGTPVTATVLTFPASGELAHPFAQTAAGAPMTVYGTPGSQLVVLQLPFGSFAAGQTPADINFNVAVAGTDTVGTALPPVTATAGFAWGENALGTPQPDWPVVQPPAAPVSPTSSATLALTPSLITLSDTYNGPQQEAASGPSLAGIYNESWTVQSHIAISQTISDFTLTNPVPNGAAVGRIVLSDAGKSWTYLVNATTGALTLDAAVSSAGAPPVVTAQQAAGTGPWVWWNAATNTVEADFGNVVGTASGSDPSITTYFTVSQYQSLGSAENSTAIATNDLTVTDMLPYGATAQTFTLTGPDGSVWTYSYANGVVSLTAGNAATAPAILTAQGSDGSRWVWYDSADGKIVADFGAAASGQWASIDAEWAGGQYQAQPGVVQQTAAAAGNMQLVDQLAGGAVAQTVTLTDGANTYVYSVGAGGVLTLLSGNAATAPGVVGVGQGAAGARWIYWDAANSRIVANLGSVVAGYSASLAATFSGGLVLNASNPVPFAMPDAPSAGGTWSDSGAAAVAVTATLPPSGGSIDGANTVYGTVLALQKDVAVADTLAPLGHLTWTIDGQVSNYFDVTNIVVTDVLSDGQHWNTGVTPTITVTEGGHTYSEQLTAGDYTVDARAADGTTTTTFNVSAALAQLTAQADLNGGAAPDDASPTAQNPATFSLSFGSQIDQSWLVPPAVSPADNWVGQGDSVSNSASVVGNILGADGTTVGAQVSDTSGAGVTLPTGVVSKSVYQIIRDGTVLWQNPGTGDVTPPIDIQTGDDVVYRLDYDLPLTSTHDLTLTDYLPLPLFSAGGMTFDTSIANLSDGATAAPAAGDIEFTSADQFHTQVNPAYANDPPLVSVDTASNAFTLNFDDIQALSPNTYPNTNIDMLFTTQVQDAAFGQGLLFTNEVTSQEVNSAGNTSSSSAIVQVVTGAPQLVIEKGVVATSDPNATFAGLGGSGAASLGGIAWSGVGSSAPFAAGTTLDSAELAAAPLADSLLNVGAGETVRYAIVVQNLGSDSQGAWDITLDDTTIPAGMSLVAGSIQAFNGAGAALSFTNIGGGLFDPNGGIELFNPSTDNTNALTDDSATSGDNVAVITYDLQLASSVPAPLLALPNTATLTGFADNAGGVNRIATIAASDAVATSEVVTAAPTITKTFVSAQDGDAANALKIGEAATFDITVTLPGGTEGSVSLGDLLPAGAGGTLDFVSGKILSIGSDITNSAGLVAGATTATGSFSFGNISVATDALGANDQIVMQVVAVAQGAQGANKGGDTLTDTGFITEANPNAGGGTLTQTAAATVTLAAPELSLTKRVEDLTTNTGYHTSIAADGGDLLKYDLTLTNAAGGATAYQITLSDLLNELGTDPLGTPNIALVGGSVVVTGPGGSVVTYPVTGGDTGVEVTLPSLAAGQSLDVTFEANVASDVLFHTNVTNTATYTADTLPTSDANFGVSGDNRVETGTASSTVTLAEPTITKALTGGSDPTITAPKLAVGEAGTFTLTANVPEGGSSDLRIEDFLPSNAGGALLSYVAGSASILSVTGVTSTAGVNLSTIGAGGVTVTLDPTHNGVIFDFGAVEGSASGQIKLALNATLQNATAVQNGVTLTNTAEVLGGSTVYGTGTAPIDVVQPDLTVVKTEAPLAPGQKTDAGSLETYHVTIDPMSDMTSAAYNVVMRDVLPTDMMVVGTPTASLGAATVNVVNGGHEIDVLVNEIAVGQAPVVLTYQAEVLNTATPGETLTDTASLSYTTQSTLDSTSVTNGRTLTPPSSSASLPVVLTPAVVKSVLSVSDPNVVAASGGVQFAQVGDTVTYQLLVTPGHGTQHLVLQDILGSGLTYEGISFASAGGTTAAAPAVTNSNGTISMDFGTIVDPAGNSGAITVDLTALVDAAPAGTVLSNSAVVTTSAPGTGAGSQTASAGPVTVQVVQPDLTISKTTSFTSGQAGSVVTYNVVVQDAPGNNDPAYDLVISDPLAAGLALVSGSETITENGQVVTGATLSETANGIVVSLPSLLAANGPLSITYKATLANNVVDTAQITNTASLSYSSATTGGQTQTASSQATIGVAIPDQFVKTLVASSGTLPLSGGTPEAVHDETLTYDFTATLGAGEQHLVISDLLPAGLDYVSSSVVSLGGTSGSALAVGASGVFSAASDTVSFDFGANGISNPASNTGAADQVVVAVTVQVDPTIAIGTTLTDTGSLTTSVPVNSYGIAPGSDQQVLTSQQSVVVVPANTISSRVFLDGACDGVYNIGDAGVPGVTVDLYTANGVFTGRTTTTDSQGNYTFTDVPDGSYEVQFVLPQGLDFTTQGVGGDATLNSQANAVTGFTPVFSLANQETDTSVNAGVLLNGDSPGQTPVQVAQGQAYSANVQTPVIVGAGDNNIHTTTGDNVTLFGMGSNVFESGNGNDVVFSCGALNAQALGANDWIFGGSGGDVLQGGGGNDYLVGGDGDDRIAGGAGITTLIGGTNTGTVTLTDGVVTGYTPGDELLPAGGPTSILFQKGDGVDTIASFDPTRDNIVIYGYAGVQSVATVNGQTVLYLGGNDAIVFNSYYQTPGAVNGSWAGETFAGISFDPTVPTIPTLSLHYDANGQPYLATPDSLPTDGATWQTLASISDVGTLQATSADERLIASDGATFTLIGAAAGQDVLIGGAGADLLDAQGIGNIIDAGEGANAIIGGAATATVTMGDGANLVLLSGSGNSLTGGDGANTVVVNGSTSAIALGNGDNSVFLDGDNDALLLGGGANLVAAIGNGETITAGNGDNSIVAIGSGTLNLGTGTDSILLQGNFTVNDSGAAGTQAFFLNVAGQQLTYGDGSAVVLGASGGNDVFLGDGDHLIELGGNGNFVQAGAGTDTIVLTGWNNLVSTGPGQDTIYSGLGNDIYSIDPAQTIAETFVGFNLGSDQIDLSKLLADTSWDQQTADLGNYVQVSGTAAGTLIGIDMSGAAGGAVTQVADLQGLGGLGLSNLLADHALKLV